MYDIIQCINSFKWLVNIKLLFLENILTLKGSNQIYNTLHDWEKLYHNYEQSLYSIQFTNRYVFLYQQPEGDDNDGFNISLILE